MLLLSLVLSASAMTLDTPVKSIDGSEKPLSAFHAKAFLLVNTASKCGYTPQYEGLEALHKKYKDKGLVVIGFPSNDFGAQEPGTEKEISEFCKVRFGVSFPLASKVKTKGEGQAPIYKYLTQDTPEGIKGEVKWNFTKFLVDGKGNVLARFEPKVEPLSSELTQAIEKAIK
jgi:glutathione peroxidase